MPGPVAGKNWVYLEGAGRGLVVVLRRDPLGGRPWGSSRESGGERGHSPEQQLRQRVLEMERNEWDLGIGWGSTSASQGNNNSKHFLTVYYPFCTDCMI